MIRRVKPLVGKARIGHAGTLDPLARGVLLVLIGAATKIADYLQKQEKEYEAEIRLGIRTDTDDITGKVLEERSVPTLDREMIERVLAQFQGELEQEPPVYSALKIAGDRSYKLARRGKTPVLPARKVLIRELVLLDFKLPLLEIRATVSKGTYIRALARDIGERLGCGATLASLTRTRIGGFEIRQAIPLDTLDQGSLPAVLISINDALSFMPLLLVKASAVSRLKNGQALMMDDTVPTSSCAPDLTLTSLVRLGDDSDRILAIAQVTGSNGRPLLKPIRKIYDFC